MCNANSPADLIPPRPSDARGLYADGFRAAVAAMHILAPGLDRAQMRVHAVRNVIPVHVRERDDYEHGASDAWARWLTNDRRTR